MKKLRASFTILFETEIPEEMTEEEAKELAEEFASECGFFPLVNDFEYEVCDA